jgi:hypothetical protein
MMDDDTLSRRGSHIGKQIVADVHYPVQWDILSLRHNDEQISVAFGQTMIGTTIHVVDKLRPVEMLNEFTDSL